MRNSGNLLRASALARYPAGASFWPCIIAALLLGTAAFAQSETPAEPTPPEAPSAPAADEDVESPTDDTGEAHAPEDEGDAPEDEGDDPEDQTSKVPASDPEEGFGMEPIQNTNIEEILIQGSADSGIPSSAPISVIGFDMDTIRSEGIKDIRDLANFTPNLEIKSAFAATSAAIFIRGVGLDDFNANAAGAVAIYQDGVFLQSGAIQLFGFFDQEKVEVLRGPQGTFYRGASAGAILIQSASPTEDFEAYLSTTYGTFDEFDLSGAISGPIVPGILTGRVAGYWNTRDGTTKNRCAGLVNKKPLALAPCNQRNQLGELLIPPRIEDRVNDVDNYGLRALLLLQPETVDMEFLLNVHGGQNLGHSYQYQNHGVHTQRASLNDPIGNTVLPPSPDAPWPDASGYNDDDNDPFAGDYDLNGPEDLDLFGTSLTWNWHFGDGFSLNSITAYEWHDRYTLENSDGNPNKSYSSEYANTAWQFSEELNLSGEWMGSDLGDGGWSIGALYLQEDLEVSNVFTAIGADQLQEYDQALRSLGMYIQGDYTLRPGCVSIGCDFKLDLGLRYNVEYKSFDITSCNYNQRVCNQNRVVLTGYEDETWDGWGGDFTLSWIYNEEDDNVYLSYSRGWKGGHFNGGALNREDIISGVRPEIVDSYEIGLRSNWFDGRLMTNLTGFFYDYQDLQVFQQQQDLTAAFSTNRLLNSQHAEVYGVEVDLRAQPIDNMNITFNAAWVESEYTEFFTKLPFRFSPPRPDGRPSGPKDTIIAFETFDYSGNDLIGAPQFSFTGSIDYMIQLPGEIDGRGLGTLTPRYSFSWKDDIFFDAGSGRGTYLNFPVATFGQPSYWLHNASLTWRSENNMFEITGWVHNMFDEWYKTASFDLTAGLRLIQNAWADPRTYGFTVTVSF